MTALARNIEVSTGSLVALIEDAATTLSGAHSAAEVLDARDKAALAYDMAKRSARLAEARDAHNTVVAAAHRAQARALEIEAGAKRRLADEYDAAQDRGEIARPGNPNFSRTEKLPAVEIPPRELHEAREIRDAEVVDPGIVKRTLDEAIDAGEEPTRAKVKRAVQAKKVRRPRGHTHTVEESQHDRDLRMLLGVWEAACESARNTFLEQVIQ